MELLNHLINMIETMMHIHDLDTKESKEWRHSGSPHGILLVDYLEKGATMTAKNSVKLLNKLRQQLSSNIESCFFKTVQRQPLYTRNWQTFTLKF
jgi:hypothetical protein